MLEMRTLREFYCIRCRNLHIVDTRNQFIRILSTGYHIVRDQRYQICICEPSILNSKDRDTESIYNIKD